MKDHKIVIMPLGGKQFIKDGVEQELRELRRITTNISCIIDSEISSKDNPLSEDRQKFVDLCKKLNFDICVTEKRATENYLSEKAIKNICGEKYCELGPYEKLSDCEHTWSKSKNWRIAREMSWDDLKDTDVGKFIERL